MTINLSVPTQGEQLRPTITVVGVGGAGGNAVNNMIASNLEGVNFIVANTDAQALDHSLTERIIQLGAGLTKGLGAGANPEVGRSAAEEAHDEIAAYIEGSNMVFITAGMGGGTGTGAAPVVARIAKEMGVLTVAVVTKPFQFEGAHRMKMAESGLKELQEYVDTLIIIPNQNLFRVANERTTFADAFRMADEVLHSGVRGVTDLMVKPGLINLDFADIRTVMREMGKAMMGTGEATGDRRAIEAAEAAISNPLLDDVSLKGARALLINITGGSDMTLFEVDEAANRVREEVDPEANIIFGSAFSDAMEGRMRVSVVATGIDVQAMVQPSGQKYQAPAEPQKRPFSFASALPKAEAPKPRYAPQETAAAPAPVRHVEPPRPAPLPVREMPVATAPVQTQYDETARERETEEMEMEMQEAPAPEVKMAPQREVAPAAQEPVRSAASVSPRREQREPQQHDDASGKGFLKRVADVGRALGARSDSGRPEALEPRVQVVQRQMPEISERPKTAAAPGDDQYLDIPAFLRRQAN